MDRGRRQQSTGLVWCETAGRRGLGGGMSSALGSLSCAGALLPQRGHGCDYVLRLGGHSTAKPAQH